MPTRRLPSARRQSPSGLEIELDQRRRSSPSKQLEGRRTSIRLESRTASGPSQASGSVRSRGTRPARTTRSVHLGKHPSVLESRRYEPRATPELGALLGMRTALDPLHRRVRLEPSSAPWPLRGRTARPLHLQRARPRSSSTSRREIEIRQADSDDHASTRAGKLHQHRGAVQRSFGLRTTRSVSVSPSTTELAMRPLRRGPTLRRTAGALSPAGRSDSAVVNDVERRRARRAAERGAGGSGGARAAHRSLRETFPAPGAPELRAAPSRGFASADGQQRECEDARASDEAQSQQQQAIARRSAPPMAAERRAFGFAGRPAGSLVKRQLCPTSACPVQSAAHSASSERKSLSGLERRGVLVRSCDRAPAMRHPASRP